MTEWKVGDKVRILKDKGSMFAPNGVYRKGEIHTVNFVGYRGELTFEGDDSELGWANRGNWFEKVEETPEKETTEFKAGDWVTIGNLSWFTPGKKYEILSDCNYTLYLIDDEENCVCSLLHDNNIEEYQVEKTTPPEVSVHNQDAPSTEDKTQKLIDHLKNNPHKSFKGLTILEDFFGIKQETKTFWSDEQ